MSLLTLRLQVNGRARRVRVPAMKRLLDVLREDCGLTGTKEGCGEGECGACTVLMNGLAVNACLVPAVQAAGAKIVTVEGLAKGPRLTKLQEAVLVMGGTQCGICTPGILVTAHALLQGAGDRVPGEDEVRTALAGNLCRCTGYQKIVDAVRAAAALQRGTGRKPRAASSSGPRRRPARQGRRGALAAGSRERPARQGLSRTRPGAPLKGQGHGVQKRSSRQSSRPRSEGSLPGRRGATREGTRRGVVLEGARRGASPRAGRSS